MFVFRSGESLYGIGNAFVLGLFAPPAVVGYFASAEKISRAAFGLLNPIRETLYPRLSGLFVSSPARGARLARARQIIAVDIAPRKLEWAKTFGATDLVNANDGDPVEMWISRSEAGHVLAEAAGWAEEYGAGRPDRDAIAGYDARYEISWPLARTDAVVGDYHTLALRLARLCDGAILDLLGGEFVQRR